MEHWVVDSIEEGTAAIEQKDRKVFHVPRMLLPEGTREGQICSVDVDYTGNGSVAVVTIAIDVAATEAALKRSAQQLASTPRSKDPGGPIQL